MGCVMKLEGLSSQQVEICDQIWKCDTKEQVTQYIKSLPKDLAKAAVTLFDLMILEHIDQQVLAQETYPIAEQMLNSLKKG